MEMSGQLRAPAAFPQEKSPWYPLDRRLGVGPKAGLDAVVKRKIPSPSRKSNPDQPLYRLSYSGSLEKL
jgi:hypothetical protein